MRVSNLEQNYSAKPQFSMHHRGSTGPAEHFLRTIPPNMAAANFVVIANGEGCELNETAVAAVLTDQ